MTSADDLRVLVDLLPAFLTTCFALVLELAISFCSLSVSSLIHVICTYTSGSFGFVSSFARKASNARISASVASAGLILQSSRGEFSTVASSRPLRLIKSSKPLVLLNLAAAGSF